MKIYAVLATFAKEMFHNGLIVSDKTQVLSGKAEKNSSFCVCIFPWTPILPKPTLLSTE